MFERILVPTDGSIHAKLAGERAFALADALDASVYVLSVVDTGPFGSIRLPGEADSAETIFAERAGQFVSDLADRAKAYDLEVTVDIRQGTPAREILWYADEIDADLVVMGSKGRSGFEKVLLGSVTEAVTRLGDVDVLVVDEAGERDERASSHR